MSFLRLLNIEDNEDDSLLLSRHLTRAGYELQRERVETAEQMAAALEQQPWDVIISDYVLPRFSALDALDMLHARGMDVPFIVISGAIGEQTAVAAMRAGAHDYLMKDNLARLVPAIEREIVEAANRRERKQAEAALHNAEKLASLGRLAATIAHEINNPLEAITNVLYLLRRHPSLDDTARNYVTVAEQELNRVANIVRQALGFSRRRPSSEPVVLSEMLKEIVELHAARTATSKVTVKTRFDIPGHIQAVSGELRQVFSNLFLNAVDAVAEGGTVTVHVARGRNWRYPDLRGVRVVIADSGPGIHPEQRTQIFEPFFSTKGEKGTGLGLWIASEIVHRHGGSIRVRSSIDSKRNGATFAVFLPAVAVPLSRRASASATQSMVADKSLAAENPVPNQ